MEAVTLKFVEHDKADACDHCIFRAVIDGEAEHVCHWDHTTSKGYRQLPCRAKGGEVERTDGKDGYWTI